MINYAVFMGKSPDSVNNIEELSPDINQESSIFQMGSKD
jgi:hypothetical protein